MLPPTADPAQAQQDGGPPAPAGMEAVRALARRWPAALGFVLTMAMVAGLGRELLGEGLEGLGRAVPTDPRFFICFALIYALPPLADLWIFRRLWRLPLAGLGVLARKRIANDVVFGYAGEAYLYAWARARGTAAPFAAVKDVSILSAMAGNALTLVATVCAAPFARGVLDASLLRLVLWSAAAVILTSLPFLIFSPRVFSETRQTLWWIFGVHCLRVVAGSALTIAAWHFALPDVPWQTWIVLTAGRLLISRLPLIPNKDLLFPNLAILLLGPDQPVTRLLAFTGAATVLVHMALVAGFGIAALARRKRVD